MENFDLKNLKSNSTSKNWREFDLKKMKVSIYEKKIERVLLDKILKDFH